MKIAVDVRELCGKPTGVGRYLSELLVEWSASPARERHEWRLYAHDTPQVPAAFRDQVSVLPGRGGTRWEQWDLARRLGADRPDVLFAPGYTAPLTAPCPIALTIHDVSFFDQPQEFAWREGLRRRQITAWSARRARIVLTDSAFSQARIAATIGVPAARIRVIHLGMREDAGRIGAATAREPIVLYAGSIFPRRHVDWLIDVFGRQVAPRVPAARLEVIGEPRLPPGTSTDAWLQALPPETRARVALRAWVDDATLRDLYRRARVFAFLSDYEGFGLTPLEALAAGIPPVVLDTPVAREVYGPAARYIPWAPPSRNGAPSPAGGELAAALIELLTDDAQRAAILQHGPEILGRYQWPRAAAQTLAAITEAAGA